ncbi:uncharacterized mitochondrial protein AtMg00810-like [Humulus lupulus]|uniref:uncharacterized mitochondrial protein AtMg00810-like n=1 Tax=Humulus lupulus TaxID=3486 RepID=UPI002B405348|nr:uncharacterized mitochondrial protein AtMg00810-like [Humulus lupulus]
MQFANSLNTPMLGGEKLSAHASDPFMCPHFYRSVVNVLQYATITRPGITYVANRVSQVMQTPLESHWKVAKKILRYLKGFCDPDWASDPDDRWSTTGFCIYLGSNLVPWTSKKQRTVSRSSTEA